MTRDELLSIQKLREQGYAVIVWTPKELDGASPHKVEDRSIEVGWEVIEELKPAKENP